jgi:nucleoid DNA-binding protein
MPLLVRRTCEQSGGTLPGLPGQAAARDPALTKSQLIADIATDNPHLRMADVELIVATIFDHITAALARGGRVELRDFGAFTVKRCSARHAVEIDARHAHHHHVSGRH